jgi:hypothetical protein
MAYTINQGLYEEHGLDRLQKGLLIGLPLLVLILSFGAFRHHKAANSPAVQSAKTIPIVSSLSSDTDKSGSGNSDSAASPGGGNSESGTGSGQIQAAGAVPGGGTSSSAGTPLVGGRGGGPTGGTGGTSGSVGGSTTIPDCSLNQIATVNCRVPACSPEVTLAPGQKAILGVAGACVVVN